MKLGGEKKRRKKKEITERDWQERQIFLANFWFGAELRGSSLPILTPGAQHSRKLSKEQWAGRGWLSPGRSSSLCCHTGKDYPGDQH